MHLADRRSAGILVAAVALAVIVAACSPNPRGTAGVSSPPPLPSSSPAWSRLDWTEAGQLTQFGIDARIAALAARDGLVLAAGTTGSSPVSGLVLLTRDGRGWERVRDVDVDGTAIVDAVAGADGFVIAGTDVDGPGLTGAVLGSADGLVWERLASLPGTRVRRLAAGPHGYVVLGDDGAGKAVVLWSRDARRWEAAGAQAFGSATVADIAATEDGWVAVGAAAVRAVTRAGTGLMALGTDDPPCEGDPEWCPHFGAAWWSVDGAHWLRLPTDGPLGQWGQRVFAVGDAGFVILDGSAVLLSTDGYQWDEVPTNGPAPRYLHVDRAVLAGDLFVVAGSWIAEEPTTLGVGAARVRR
jgi:hypothetical protein